MTNTQTISTPIPGVVYLRPSPESNMYFQPGDYIEKGSVIALIEVMKNFYEIQEETNSILEDFYVQDGDTVDIGTEIAVLKIASISGKEY